MARAQIYVHAHTHTNTQVETVWDAIMDRFEADANQGGAAHKRRLKNVHEQYTSDAVTSTMEFMLDHIEASSKLEFEVRKQLFCVCEQTN